MQLMQKKLMILGASILQLPAILKAKEMRLQTIAVDMDENAVGFKEADINLVISTIDIPKVVAAAKKYEVDGIMTLASDMPMRTVAAVAKELGIVGITEDTALKATNKAIMRECLKENNVPIPRFFKTRHYEEYRNIIKQFNDIFIVKPTDNSGSRGVYLVQNISNAKELDYAFNYAKASARNGEVIVEEFMEGPEVSVETLSIDGDVHVIAITDKMTTGAPRFVEMGHSQPSNLDSNIKEQISVVAKAAVRAIGIVNGPSHTEIKITGDGPKIVELGARLGGDNITTYLVPLSTGVDMVESCINIALGEKPDISRKLDCGSAVKYFESSKGILECVINVKNAELIPGVKKIVFTKHLGDSISDIQSSTDRIGFVIAQGRNSQEAIKMCEEAINIIDIRVTTEKK